MSSETAIDETVDRLYGLPPEEFVAARNEAVRALRKAGQREAAAQVGALRKPTVAAAAVNRLVRKHRDEVERFLGAAAALRDAQFSGVGDLATATRQERKALDRLTSLGGEEVRRTLLAAAVDDAAAELLLEARLEREPEPRGFGTLLAHARPTGAKLRAASARPAGAAASSAPPTPAPPVRKKPVDDAARGRLRGAQAALSAAEAEERRARRRWDQARTELEEARAAVEKEQSDLDRLRDG